MAFVQRVATWLANELVVKTLAENKAFQRFALRSDETMAKTSEAVRTRVF